MGETCYEPHKYITQTHKEVELRLYDMSSEFDHGVSCILYELETVGTDNVT